MPDPQEVVFDISNQYPTFSLTLDVSDHPNAQSEEMVKRLSFVENQDIVLDVFFKKRDETLVPPALVPVDIAGWKAKWTTRQGDQVGDDLIFSRDGVIQGASANGQMRFTVSGVSVTPSIELAASQFKVFTDGLDTTPPEIVEDAQVTIRPVLSDS
jgi:hypothetical protein